jgi:hypothetical protein
MYSTSNISSLEAHIISSDELDIDVLEDEEYANLLQLQQIELNELKQQHQKQLDELTKTFFDENEILSCFNKNSSFGNIIIL